MGVIAPAETERAAPILLAPKQYRSSCFCVDYRKINAILIRDSYPTQRMNECIDLIGDAKIVSALGANRVQCKVRSTTQIATECFHIAPRDVQIFNDAIWIVQRPWHISITIAFIITCDKMAICPSIPRRYYHIFP